MISSLENRRLGGVWRSVAAAAAIASLGACGDEPASDAADAPRVVRAAGLEWRMTLPANAEIREDEAAVYIDLAPGRRRPRAIRLGPPELEPEAYASESALPEGGVVSYDLSLANAGSGGTEAFLDGIWRRDDAALAVSCWAQAETPPPKPDWCLTYLATLTPASQPDHGSAN